MEGLSLVPAFTNNALERSALYWEHEGNRAVRVGEWKLVAQRPGGGKPVNWELYNIEADRSEMHNLAAEQPDRVQQLSTMWDAYAKRANVMPTPWDKPRAK